MDSKLTFLLVTVELFALQQFNIFHYFDLKLAFINIIMYCVNLQEPPQLQQNMLQVPVLQHCQGCTTGSRCLHRHRIRYSTVQYGLCSWSIPDKLVYRDSLIYHLRLTHL